MGNQTNPVISKIKPESWLVAAGRAAEPGAPLNVPLIPASNFILGQDRSYARNDGTPTWEALEEIVGGLEAGRAVAFASGMAAVAAVFDQLRTGAVVVLPDDCYQGVASLAAAGAERGRWSVQRVAVDDTTGWIRAGAAGTRLAYAVVSPQRWIEDFGSGQLLAGQAEIALEPLYAASISAAQPYRVFLTPLGDCPLYVAGKAAASFTVRALDGRQCSVDFDFRIVAPRRGDEARRFEQFTVDE